MMDEHLTSFSNGIHSALSMISESLSYTTGIIVFEAHRNFL
jgi:hypothetical protein